LISYFNPSQEQQQRDSAKGRKLLANYTALLAANDEDMGEEDTASS
jgi:hypothetical protein